LHEAGRLEEALEWVREGGPYAHATLFGLVEDDAPDDSPAVRQALLEAAILKDMGRKAERSDVLWDHFARTLAPDILRADHSRVRSLIKVWGDANKTGISLSPVGTAT